MQLQSRFCSALVAGAAATAPARRTEMRVVRNCILIVGGLEVVESYGLLIESGDWNA